MILAMSVGERASGMGGERHAPARAAATNRPSSSTPLPRAAARTEGSPRVDFA